MVGQVVKAGHDPGTSQKFSPGANKQPEIRHHRVDVLSWQLEGQSSGVATQMVGQVVKAGHA
jgi:hypothetical protein